MCGGAIRAAGLLLGVMAALVLAGWMVWGLTGLLLAGVAGVGLVLLCYYGGEKLALRAVSARPISEVQYPALYRVARELATEARQPVPRIYLSSSATPMAFAVGRGPRNGGICVSAGLLGLLGERELRGVMAHELAHIYSRDVLLSSFTVTVAILITWIVNLAWLLPLADSADDDGESGLLSALLFLVVGPVAALAVQVGVSRSRELRADEAAVRLTGDPEGLALALRRIAVGVSEHPPERDRALLAASHLMIAHPLPPRGLGRLFATHPPLRRRLARLRRMRDFPFE